MHPSYHARAEEFFQNYPKWVILIAFDKKGFLRMTQKSLALAVILAFVVGLLVSVVLDFRAGLAETIFIHEAKHALFEFQKDSLPTDSDVDINIGTNFSPMEEISGRKLVLVDPLFEVCDKISRLKGVYFLCIAVSNFTGLSSFREYNNKGVSSSLATVTKGTSHERLNVIRKRQVFVLEGLVLFRELLRTNRIKRVKLDMQGFELSLLRNIRPLLKSHPFEHVKAECFCPKHGKQIYAVDNSCAKIDSLLSDEGYVTTRERWEKECARSEWSDVLAHSPSQTESLDF